MGKIHKTQDISFWFNSPFQNSPARLANSCFPVFEIWELELLGAAAGT
jgi:hypothetical protein